MAGFSKVSELVESQITDGEFQYSSFRKVPSQATSVGIWCDLSMSSGNPVPNYYAAEPLLATILDGNKGLYHGQNVGTKIKSLAKVTIMSTGANAVPLSIMMCDYLLYYSFIDMNNTDEQLLDNTVTLPRYTNGVGVRAFLVALTPTTGAGTFQLNYTNSDGVSGRITESITCNSGLTIASFIHSGPVARSFGSFTPLQSGDVGIRSVESITFLTPNGGLCALVLVKPISTTTIREITAPREIDYFKDTPSMPRIYDGAYLNFIALPRASLATIPIIGDITTVWK